MAISVNSTKQALADKYGSLGAYISIHTGSPGSTGANEVSGGGYARKQTTWSSATNGTINGSQVEIDVPSGTFTYIGIWSAATGGTFIDGTDISSTTLGGTGKMLITPQFKVQ